MRFRPGEVVTMQVVHADGSIPVGMDHQPWTVTANESGQLVTTWTVCMDDCIGATLRETADGATSGLHAEVLFTDAPATSTVTVTAPACALGGSFTIHYTGGSNNSQNIIGTTPQSFVMKKKSSYSINQIASPVHGNTYTGPSTVPGSAPDGGLSATVTLSYADLQPPGFTSVPANATYGCEDQVPPLSAGAATATDNCGSPVVSVNQSSNGGLGSGGNPLIYTRTFTAVDSAGNSASATQVITVADSTPPSISAPAAVNVNTAAGACSATVNLAAPAATDNCAVASVVSNHPSSSFSEGTTIVTWTATDVHGNKATAQQVVTVSDHEPPAFVGLASLTVPSNTGACSASNVNLGVSASDNCGVASLTNDAPATFPCGTTIVHWTVTDVHGNSATASQSVTVVDNQPPVVNPPPAISLDLAHYSVSALGTANPTDNCGVAGCSNNAPAAVSNVGTFTVTWSATDIHGNCATGSQAVTITYGSIDGWAVGVTASFLQPLDASPVVVKAKVGSTVPVKFQLTNCPGYAAAVANISVAMQGGTSDTGLTYTDVDVSSTSAADSGTLFRYSGSGCQYIYNLSTKGFQVGRTYRIRASLADGQIVEGFIYTFR